MRDLRMIAYKMKYVMLPKMSEDKGRELRNCLFNFFNYHRGFMGAIGTMLSTSNVT